MDPLMTIWVFCIGSMIGIIIGVILAYKTAVVPLQDTIQKSQKTQQNYDEQMKYYPYNPEQFRFIGSPVDGIQFEENTILFVRFKKDSSMRSPEQDHLKTLVENGKVRWYEFTTK
jgi:predicted Holliday junction resolvase-like endonuclease